MSDLERFIKGDMGQNEMEQFTKEMVSKQLDAETRQRWEATLRTKYGVKRKVKPSSKLGKNRFRYFAIAASIAILIALFSWFQFSDGNTYRELTASYIEELPIMADQIVFRKGAGQVSDLRSKAYAAYSRADFDMALANWQQLAAMDSLNAYDQFYWGISCLRQTPANTACTIERLASLSNQVPELVQEIDWVLGLAYLKDNDIDKAKPLLEKIVDESQFMDELAVQLLSAIQEEN
ncbi:MAG: hypothetical protein AAGF87_18725 [Bacteroidota bacterium]